MFNALIKARTKYESKKNIIAWLIFRTRAYIIKFRLKSKTYNLKFDKRNERMSYRAISNIYIDLVSIYKFLIEIDATTYLEALKQKFDIGIHNGFTSIKFIENNLEFPITGEFVKYNNYDDIAIKFQADHKEHGIYPYFKVIFPVLWYSKPIYEDDAILYLNAFANTYIQTAKLVMEVI